MRPLHVLLIDLGPSRPELHEPLGLEVLLGSLSDFPTKSLESTAVSASFDNIELATIDFSRYDIVGLSAKIGTFSRLSTTLHKLTELSKRPIVVVGDLLGTFAYQQILEIYPEAICVQGEGEDAFREIVRSALETTRGGIRSRLNDPALPNLIYLGDNNEICMNPVRFVDLSKAHPPRRLFLAKAIELYSQVQIEGSRGCPWGQCSFCSIPAIQGSVWRPFDVDFVIQQLIEVSEAGSSSPYFTDADFLGDDVGRVIYFGDRVLDQKKQGNIRNGLNFYLNLQVSGIVGGPYTSQTQSVEMLKKLKAAGLREVFVGIESGSRRQVRRYKKAATIENNLKALRTLRELGIDYDIGFMMFDPTMEVEDLQETLEFIRIADIQAHPSRLTKAMRLQPRVSYSRPEGNELRQLNVNNLTYEYDFSDERMRRIYSYYRSWEITHLPIFNLIQGASKGEVRSETERTSLRTFLGQLRRIDLSYLQYCTDLVLQESDSPERVRIVRSAFGTQLNRLLRKMPEAVRDHASLLHLDLTRNLDSQPVYLEKFRVLNSYEDPVNNKYLR